MCLSCLRSKTGSGHLTHLRRCLGAGELAAIPLAVFPEAGSTPGFLHRQLRSLLNIDDCSWNACLTVEHGESASVAHSLQSASCITLRVTGAINNQFAAADHAITIPIPPTYPF